MTEKEHIEKFNADFQKLKHNREKVPLEELQTRYAKSYEALLDDVRANADWWIDTYIQTVGFKVARDDDAAVVALRKRIDNSLNKQQERRRVRLRRSDPKAPDFKWLRSPRDIVASMRVTHRDGSVEYASPNIAHGVAFGFRCCLVACTVFWWLRSPSVSYVNAYIRVATGGGWVTDTSPSALRPSESRGVAFGFWRFRLNDSVALVVALSDA